MTILTEAPSGLDGLVVTTTATGDVRGDEGTFHYRGYDATELARRCSLEEVWHLMVVGRLPDAAEHERFTARVARARGALPAPFLDGLARGGDRLAALRTAWSAAAAEIGCRPWIDLTPEQRLGQAIDLAALGPVLVAAIHRPGVGADLDRVPAGTAAGYLQLLTGAPPSAAHIAALERYLVLTIDHGLNASTFTARTVTSTGADLGAALVAALGALSGPLHGGAPSRALEMLDAIGEPDRAEGWVRGELARGRRIMGFGHRLYRTEDPRAGLLRDEARRLGGERIELAMHVEDVVLRVLREVEPERHLDVNVEYYAAVVLEAVGIPPALFTPTFAISRAIGWTAHALEQVEGNRIVRPSARYTGPGPGRELPADRASAPRG